MERQRFHSQRETSHNLYLLFLQLTARKPFEISLQKLMTADSASSPLQTTCCVTQICSSSWEKAPESADRGPFLQVFPCRSIVMFQREKKMNVYNPFLSELIREELTHLYLECVMAQMKGLQIADAFAITAGTALEQGLRILAYLKCNSLLTNVK